MLYRLGTGFSKQGKIAQETGAQSLQGAVASCVFDIDATQTASYPGTGQVWANLVAAPADGSLQADYDFLRGGNDTDGADDPAYNGAGPSAYWSFDGGDFFTLKSGVNPPFIADLHKTTGGSGPFWIAVTCNMADNSWSSKVASIMSTTNATGGGDGWLFGKVSSERFRLSQKANGVLTALDSPVQSAGDMVVVYSFNPAANSATFWTNTVSGVTGAFTYGATAGNATGVLRIGANEALSEFLDAEMRLYSVAMGNEYLDDAKAAALIAALEARHERDYTP